MTDCKIDLSNESAVEPVRLAQREPKRLESISSLFDILKSPPSQGMKNASTE